MELSVELLLHAYRQGIFPMGSPNGIDWYCPDPRAIVPFHTVRPGRTMRKVLNSGRYEITFDRAFTAVMEACADREETWITPGMIEVYTELHRRGHAHSTEAWHGDELVGGIYGVSMGAAFFGESMFTRADNAGKLAFHHLLHRLRERGYLLFDSQIINDFTRSLGAVEVPFEEFQRMLTLALRSDDRW